MQLPGLEVSVLPEREVEPFRHLHLAEPHPLTVPREMLNDDREHGAAYPGMVSLPQQRQLEPQWPLDYPGSHVCTMLE